MGTSPDRHRRPYAGIHYSNSTGFAEIVATSGTPQPIANAGLAAGAQPRDPEGLGAFTVDATAGTITCTYASDVQVDLGIGGISEDASDLPIFALELDSVATDLVLRHLEAAAVAQSALAGSTVIHVPAGGVLRVTYDSNDNADQYTIKHFHLNVVELNRLG